MTILRKNIPPTIPVAIPNTKVDKYCVYAAVELLSFLIRTVVSLGRRVTLNGLG